MKPGDTVQRLHPNDGSALAEQPHGPILTIIEVRQNPYWVSCKNGIEHYYVLSDRSWEIEANLMRA